MAESAEFQPIGPTPTGAPEGAPAELEAPEGMIWSVLASCKQLCLMALGIAFLMALNLYWRQDGILYHPQMAGVPKHPRDNPAPLSSPGDSGMQYSTVPIPTPDGETLHSWLIRAPASTTVPTLVYFHGNAGNMGMRLPNVKLLVTLTKCNVFMVEYRGYGGSTGTPSEAGLELDATSALDALSWRDDIDPTKIVFFGRSLGGAVAVAAVNSTSHYTGTSPAHFAAAVAGWTPGPGPDNPAGVYPGAARALWVRGLILENTFTSIKAMVERLFPWWVQTLRPLVQRIHYPTVDRIAGLRLPMLFLSSDLDSLIPSDHMHTLAAAAGPGLRQFYTVEGATHNDAWQKGGIAYYEEWTKFLAEAADHSAPSAHTTHAELTAGMDERMRDRNAPQQASDDESGGEEEGLDASASEEEL